MHLKEDMVIGIVGGMGPRAGAALVDSIMLQTNAATDQEHLSVVLMSFPRHLADRTAFLEGAAVPNPAYNICRIIGKLENAGASLIGIACNASHAPEIYDVILRELARMGSKVKLLHMPLETCCHIRDNFPRVRRVGVLSTNGTYRSQIYPQILRDLGLEALVPDETFQRDVIHKMIYDPLSGIKCHPSGITASTMRQWKQALSYFKDRDAEAVILGCTELSLIPAVEEAEDLILVDSTAIMAAALIREATCEPMKKHVSNEK